MDSDDAAMLWSDPAVAEPAARVSLSDQPDVSIALILSVLDCRCKLIVARTCNRLRFVAESAVVWADTPFHLDHTALESLAAHSAGPLRRAQLALNYDSGPWDVHKQPALPRINFEALRDRRLCSLSLEGFHPDATGLWITLLKLPAARSLRQLTVGHLTGTSFFLLKLLPKLELLSVSPVSSDLCQTITVVALCASLRRLVITGTDIRYPDDAYMTVAPQITELTLHHCKIAPSSFEQLAMQLPNLESLRVFWWTGSEGKLDRKGQATGYAAFSRLRSFEIRTASHVDLDLLDLELCAPLRRLCLHVDVRASVESHYRPSAPMLQRLLTKHSQLRIELIAVNALDPRNRNPRLAQERERIASILDPMHALCAAFPNRAAVTMQLPYRSQ